MQLDCFQSFAHALFLRRTEKVDMWTKFFFLDFWGVFSCDRSIYFVYGNVSLVDICLDNDL